MSTTANINTNLLLKPFPAEAMQTLVGAAKLTTIKAGYITERINEVWGHGNWTFEILETQQIEDEVICKVQFCPSIGLPITQYGGSKKMGGKSWGDTYKSAVTDALTKCASYYGIGNEVFKGNIDAYTLAKMKNETKATTSQVKSNSTNTTPLTKASASQVRYIETLMANKKMKMPDFDIKAIFSKYNVKSAADLDKMQASQLIESLQK
jgi:hypothetical protein